MGGVFSQVDWSGEKRVWGTLPALVQLYCSIGVSLKEFLDGEKKVVCFPKPLWIMLVVICSVLCLGSSIYLFCLLLYFLVECTRISESNDELFKELVRMYY